jgi:urea transport system permease protein
VPGLLALVFGWLAFRSRVTGVYLSILTQAMTLALSLYLFQNDTGLRGNNGLSGLQNIPGAESIGQDRLSVWFFWASALALGLGYVGAAWLVSGKFGNIVRGIRDDEARALPRLPGGGLQARGLHAHGDDLRRRGRALLSAGGHHQPDEIAPIASIYLAVWVAIGGRGRLYGAVIGRRSCRCCRPSSPAGARPMWTSASTDRMDRLVAGAAGPRLRARDALRAQGVGSRDLFDYLVRKEEG